VGERERGKGDGGAARCVRAAPADNLGAPGCSVSAEDFSTLYADMRRFFALDVDTKRLVCTTTNAHNRGWTPLGEETLDPARQSCGDTKEGYYIGRDIGSDHKLAHLPLHGPNVWPPPNLLPGWRENMERYVPQASTFIRVNFSTRQRSSSQHFDALGAEPLAL
jgi:hypothetical protein